MIAFVLAAMVALPTPTPSPTPKPSPTATPLKTIGHVIATGRSANLVGTVDAASTGTISQEEISTRPILRPGEVLEAIPGLVISQHSGGGKANQYYLRGFQLDHGTDLEATIVGAPVNLPTHAHGQGYSDINWLIPELVSTVEFKKGPYYADQGDFSTAGSYNLYYRDTIDPIVEATVGGYDYGRFLVAASPKLGDGNLLYAFEYVHDNSTMDKPDNYLKYNGVLRWSRSTPNTNFNITAMAYNGEFDASDQIPQRLVDAGIIDRFGYIDPSDGGITHRYALTAQLKHDDPKGETDVTAYAFQQYLDLFSNFTYYEYDANDYYNVTANPVTCNTAYTTCSPGAQHVSTYTSYCPQNSSAPAGAPVDSVTPKAFSFSCGDQREQQDKRFVTGFDAHRIFGNGPNTTTVGISVRNDNIAQVGLFLTSNRIRYALGTLSDAHVVERDSAVYMQSIVHIGSKLRAIVGLRGDAYNFNVLDQVAANSGAFNASIASPKLALAYEISPNQEAYADFGDSYHSNDARGVTQTLDPQTHAIDDPTGTAVAQVTPLVRAKGEELGYRYSVPKFTGTVSLWQLNIASELIFDGDHGVTVPGGPTVRRGLELANFYTPLKWLTFDLDYATSSAQFTTNPQNLGTDVPESLNEVISAGATIDGQYYSTSLRVRYFGPRVLTQDGTAVSPPSTIFNGQYTAKLKHRKRLTFELLNIFNAHVADVTYYYQSWLPHDAANLANAENPAINPALGGTGINDYHFHPSEARTFRLSLSTPL